MSHRILVVDDEIETCQAIQEYLASSSRDYKVEYALGGMEALEKVRAAPPELVLLDIRMPGMGGEEVLAGIQARSPSTSVIMVTAVREIEVGVRCMKLGAIDYITKPIDFDDLEQRILDGLLLSRSSSS